MNNDRSAIYNNAGVRMMGVANENVALELFRGALESKLAFERCQMPLVNISGQGEVVQRCVTPDLPVCLNRAEMHLGNLDTYLSQENSVEHRSIHHDLLIERLEEGASEMDDGMTVPLQCRGYDPFICKAPFEIPENEAVITQITSSVIVFNLGLVHQCMCRTSPKAASFYEISAALLASIPETSDTLLLRISLLNNFGVWSFENGDGDSSERVWSTYRSQWTAKHLRSIPLPRKASDPTSNGCWRLSMEEVQQLKASFLDSAFFR
jgi:hypothetical protein